MRADIVIAARGGPAAKSRCAAVMTPSVRARLVEAMLSDMLGALERHHHEWSVHVVTPTAELAAIAVACGAQVIFEPGPLGLNAAFDLAQGALAAGPGAPTVFLPGDLPLLDANDVAAALAAWRPGVAVIAPSRDGGTGAVVVGRDASFGFRFGNDSLQAHLSAARAAGLKPLVIDGGSLALDLDRPDHVRRIAAARPRSHTARALGRTVFAQEAAA